MRENASEAAESGTGRQAAFGRDQLPAGEVDQMCQHVARKSEEIRAAKAGRCCAWCGTTLPVEMLSTAQFCSQTCRNREYSAMVAAERARERVRDCEECGVTFTPKRRTARFCSARCGKVNWDQRQGSPRR